VFLLPSALFTKTHLPTFSSKFAANTVMIRIICDYLFEYNHTNNLQIFSEGFFIFTAI